MRNLRNKNVYGIMLKSLLVILFTFILVGCNNQIEQDVITNRNTDEDVQEYIGSNNVNIDNNLFDSDIDFLYGSWVVGDVAFRDITAVTKDGLSDKAFLREKLVGDIIEYTEECILYNGLAYEIESVYYEYEYLSACISRLNMLKYIHFDFMDEHDLADSDECVEISISTAQGNGYPPLGTNIIVINEDHLLYFTAGTFFNVYKVDSEIVEELELPTPPPLPDPEYLYGKWTIEAALNHIDGVVEDYIGYPLEYQRSFIKLGNNTYENPVYSYDVRMGMALLQKWWFGTVDFGTLESEYVYTQFIFIEDEHFEELGMYFYYADNDILLLLHEDIFYLARRD